MRKFILPILLLLAIIVGASYWFYFKPKKDHAPPVLFGNVEIREAEASFRQPGRIANLLVEEGDVVKEGQLLAEIDSDVFEESIAAANAEIAATGAEVSKLKTGSRPEEIALAEAGVKQALAVYNNAEEDFKRQSALLPSGSVSEKMVDAIKTQRDVAKANLDAAQKTLDLRKAGFRKEDISVGENKLAAAKANREKLFTALDDTKLYAPVSGTITARPKEKGAYITPNFPVFTIAITDPIYIRAYVPEPQLGKFAPGTKVLVKTDSSNKEYEGQIGFVSPRSEFTPKTVETEDLRSDLVYRVRIIVKQSDGKLLQGMPVTVKLPVVK